MNSKQVHQIQKVDKLIQHHSKDRNIKELLSNYFTNNLYDQSFITFYESVVKLKEFQQSFANQSELFRKVNKPIQKFKGLGINKSNELESLVAVHGIDDHDLLYYFERDQYVLKVDDQLYFSKSISPGFFGLSKAKTYLNYFQAQYLKNPRSFVNEVKENPFRTMAESIGTKLDYYNNFTYKNKKPYRVFFSVIQENSEKYGLI